MKPVFLRRTLACRRWTSQFDGWGILPFDAGAAAKFGRIASSLAARGTPIGEFDTLIAAHACAARCTMVTNNVRHFSKVPGLVVERWA